MAYTTPSVTRVPGDTRSRDMYVITFSGTSLAPATEVEITGLPLAGRVLFMKAFGSAAGGGAATSQPVLGTLTNPLGGTQAVLRAGSATAIGTPVIQAGDNGATPYYSSTGSLFYRSSVDTGTFSDDVVIYVMDGWRG
jgi:hypothetical protein